MSDADVVDYQKYEAPVTGWSFLLKIWWVLVGILGLVIFVVLKDSIPASWQYGYLTGVAVFAIVYWQLGIPEGWALDTTKMDSGHVGLTPLNKYQIEDVQAKPKMMMFSSEEGVVALIGHKLVSLDKDGKPEIHAQLELQTNSEIARAVARVQKKMIAEYLLLKSEVDVAVAAEFMEWYQGWRMKTRADPEKMNDSD